jgi:hypothetical protein
VSSGDSLVNNTVSRHAASYMTNARFVAFLGTLLQFGLPGPFFIAVCTNFGAGPLLSSPIFGDFRRRALGRGAGGKRLSGAVCGCRGKRRLGAHPTDTR